MRSPKFCYLPSQIQNTRTNDILQSGLTKDHPAESSLRVFLMIRKGSVLEVERKFRSLAVPKLSRHSGNPSFQSLRSLGSQTFRDIYYDRFDILSSAGIWVRSRNGEWQAKIKKGGNFTNSMFEELSGAESISSYVGQLLGCKVIKDNAFGLEPIASMTTDRMNWLADNKFQIVLDKMDFGHTVGEIELQMLVDLEVTAEGASIEEQKGKLMREMDEKIITFMDRYSWAFTPGEPKGKLSAYFEVMSRRCQSPYG